MPAHLKYTPDMCVKLTSMMKLGFTQEEVCAAVGVTPKTFIEWRKKDGPYYIKEFAEAFDRAKVLQKAWWLSRGRDNIGDGRDFNTPLFGLYMANLFGWSGSSKREDEAMEEIRKLKEQMGLE